MIFIIIWYQKPISHNNTLTWLSNCSYSFFLAREKKNNNNYQYYITITNTDDEIRMFFLFFGFFWVFLAHHWTQDDFTEGQIETDYSHDEKIKNYSHDYDHDHDFFFWGVFYSSFFLASLIFLGFFFFLFFHQALNSPPTHLCSG